MSESRQPVWQPIGMLPTIAAMVTEMVDGADEQHRLLAGARPYSLDNATLDRVERVYRDGGADNGVFEQQVARWQREHPDAVGLAELAAKVAELGPAYQRVLDLAGQLRAVTIEALLAKSDLEVGMEALLGGPVPGAGESPRH